MSNNFYILESNIQDGNIDRMKWIKVSERLPKKAGYYFVVADWMGIIEKGEFDGKSKWNIPHLFQPTHWMTLPELPDELD